MKSNRGVTLTSLIIYVIVFSFVIGTAAMLTKYFRQNVDETVISVNTPEQYSKFTTYLTEDINSVNFDDIEGNDSGTQINIRLADGTFHIYLYEGDQIYFVEQNGVAPNKKIKLCSNISNCQFDYDSGTKKLNVKITINEITYNNTYNIG
ncbi:MAG: hypothetical protein HFJ17_03985 [Clostridia bacterium]|nr:hypothetical protein [Clostridia bacterium]